MILGDVLAQAGIGALNVTEEADRCTRLIHGLERPRLHELYRTVTQLVTEFQRQPAHAHVGRAAQCDHHHRNGHPEIAQQKRAKTNRLGGHTRPRVFIKRGL